MNNILPTGEEILEAGKQVGKQAVTQTIQTAKQQLTGSKTPSAVDQKTGIPDQNNQDFIKDLYGASNNQQNPNPQNGQQVAPQNSQTPPSSDAQKTVEQNQLETARKKLHMESYYIPTFESPQKQEENVADKLEREEHQEKMKKMEELHEEQKKNEVPMAVRMAQNAEKHRGAAG